MVDRAATLLKDFTLEDGLYEHTFKYITENHYNRQRALIAIHFHNLLEYPTVTSLTLQDSLDKLNSIMRGLQVFLLHM